MIGKEEARNKINVLVKEFLEYPKEVINKKSESQIRSEFIDPLFEALGWDMRKDVEREERVLKGRVDYILRIGYQNKLVIEAKAVDIKLLEDEGRQAVSYAYHTDIKFAVLTNFKQIRVYHALSNTKNIDKNLLKDEKGYFTFDCEKFIEQFDRLWLLSKESLEREEINKLLDNIDKRLIKPIDESILTDLLEFRGWLSTDLKNKRTYLSPPQIDEIVQILIDRLIFMRSVEDRGLEEKDFLLKKIADVQQGRTDKNLWSSLIVLFKIFDKEYNSKLFSAGLLEKEGFFEEKTLIKIINGFYYGTQEHQDRYMFDIIPIDLLGSIYEQYLGVVLRGTEKRVKLDLLSGKRKSMGIYYTPSYIVDYIVKNTVGEYIKNKTIDEILEVKIVDPACGSGSFLIKAFQELIEAIEKRLKKGEKSKSSQFSYFKDRLDLGQKSAILERCIYGVDLDEKAVELAQLNLLLKILDEETRETRKRILPYMRDNIQNGNSLISDSKYEKAFNWNAQFPSIKEGGFDVVIGNPPWVSIKGKQKSLDLSEEELNYLLKKYPCDKYRPNLFEMFIWKGLELIKKEGYFGFIVPDRLANNLQFKNLREEILKNRTIKSLWFRPEFEGVISDNIIFTIKNSNLIEDSQIKIAVYPNVNFKSIPQKEYLKLENMAWTFVDGALNKIFERIRGDKNVFELSPNFETKVGFIAESGKVTENKIGEQIKVFKGRNILRYKTEGNYFFDFKKTNLVGGTQDKEKLSKKDKVFLRKTGMNIIASFDNSGTYPEQSVYFVYTNDEKSDEELKILCALLNSKLLNCYYQNFAITNKDATPQLKKVDLDKFPIKMPDEKQSKRIIQLVDRMMEFCKVNKLEQQIKNVDYEIDEEVYKLYGITAEEKKIIEESLK